MAETGVRVEGLNRLVRTLNRAKVDIAELKDAHQRAAAIVAADASSRAPRRTGALAGSIRPARQARRARVMAGRASVPYAGPIEFGWPARNIEEAAFLRGAAQDTEPQWLIAYQRDIQAALDKVKGA